MTHPGETVYDPLPSRPAPMAARTLFLFGLLIMPGFAQSVPDWAAPVERGETIRRADEAFAEGTDPGTPGVPNIVPIDGGLALLALAGGAYAAARLRRRGR